MGQKSDTNRIKIQAVILSSGAYRLFCPMGRMPVQVEPHSI